MSAACRPLSLSCCASSSIHSPRHPTPISPSSPSLSRSKFLSAFARSAASRCCGIAAHDDELAQTRSTEIHRQACPISTSSFNLTFYQVSRVTTTARKDPANIGVWGPWVYKAAPPRSLFLPLSPSFHHHRSRTKSKVSLISSITYY